MSWASDKAHMAQEFRDKKSWERFLQISEEHQPYSFIESYVAGQISEEEADRVDSIIEEAFTIYMKELDESEEILRKKAKVY